ncbi:MAG: hypothetical protein ABJN65_02320 [Parasphingorhabdus sp.]
MELKRDNLGAISESLDDIKSQANSGSFDPSRYDLYLLLDTDIFNSAFKKFGEGSFTLAENNRPIRIDVSNIDFDSRAGNARFQIDASATDLRTNVTAGIKLDSRVIIERINGDDALYVRLVATKLVPELRWGILNFAKSKFVKRLLELEATKITSKLPKVSIPINTEFKFGQPARTEVSGRLPTGNGSWIKGRISYPDTHIKSGIEVKHMIFLDNGIHLFANVETGQ